MTASGFGVDYRALAGTAKGLEAVIGELSKLGISETGEEGRGFALLDLDERGFGHAGLAGAFSGFTHRWSWGVRSLVQDGNQFAQRLGLNAGVYADTEHYLSGTFKDLVNADLGDPHASSDQVEKESYGQIFGAWKPSLDDSGKALDEMKTVNRGELHDVETSPPPWWLL